MTDKEKCFILEKAINDAINILNEAKRKIEETERTEENIKTVTSYMLQQTIESNKKLEKKYTK